MKRGDEMSTDSYLVHSATSGGYLSQPSKKYPFLFSTKDNGVLALDGLWEKYPYFLPCVVSATITWCSILLGIFFLEETLASKVRQKKEKEEAKRSASERTGLLSEISQPTSYDSTAMNGGDSTQSLRENLSNTLPNNTAAGERPAFGRPTRKRSRMPLIHVQSWTSGFTPAQSRDASPAPRAEEQSQGSSSHQRTPMRESSTAHVDGGKDEGIFGLLKIAHIRRIMLSYAFLSLTSVSLDSVQVLYFVSREWSPPSSGLDNSHRHYSLLLPH